MFCISPMIVKQVSARDIRMLQTIVGTIAAALLSAVAVFAGVL